MQDACWQVWPDRGFLMRPDPAPRLTDLLEVDFPLPRADVEAVEALARRLPDLLAMHQIRQTAAQLPEPDMTPLRNHNGYLAIERLHQCYAFIASAYLHATFEPPAPCLPRNIAVPFAELSRLVGRPPILSYCDYPLSAYRRLNLDGPLALDNLTLNLTLTGLPDEIGFILVHVEVEARAASGLAGLEQAIAAAEQDDAASVMAGLTALANSLDAMIRAFGQMRQQCDPDVFYADVRPYMFGFAGVVFEGVDDYGGQPQTVRGGSGAQSSVIPAMVAGLGLRHEQTDLMQHMDVMKTHMPRPHRAYLVKMGQSRLRDFVLRHGPGSGVADAYNTCLDRVMKFRRLHLHYANVYIFQKVDNPLGTGGTAFMHWLDQLIGETERQLI